MLKKNNDFFFQKINSLTSEVNRLENLVYELNDKIEKQHALFKQQLVRMNNKEFLTNDYLKNSRHYLDLTPEKALELYNREDFDFILLDVSDLDSNKSHHFPEAIHIPWCELKDRFTEIPTSYSTPILVISEDGTSSINACEFLYRHGYLNCSNISGGYLYWPKENNQLKTA